MAVENFTLNLSSEAAKAVRHALLVGLQSYGEIERVLARIEGATEAGVDFDHSLIPRRPVESDDVISTFAEALAVLS